MTTLASRVGRKAEMTASKINRTAGAKRNPFPHSKGALLIVPVTPGANLTGRGMKA